MSDEPTVLKQGTCPSLSGASTLTYEIAQAGDDCAFRITANTGGGLFGKEWVYWSALEPALKTSPITAGSLKRAKVCKGKSANTPGFVLAVLKAEGLVTALEEGGHTAADPGPILEALSKLQDANPKPTRRKR